MESDLKNKSIMSKLMFGILRLVRFLVGFIAALQVITIFPALSWVTNPSGITTSMYFSLGLKVFMLIFFSILFYAVGKLIHIIHKRIYNCPHPSLIKSMAL